MSGGLDHLDFVDVEVLAEVARIVKKTFAVAGSDVPALSDPAWLTAPPVAKVARLLVLAEAHLLSNPRAIAAQLLKDASVDLGTSRDWSEAAMLPSHRELVRRRAELGPLAGLVFDPVREARWVATGSGEDEDVAA